MFATYKNQVESAIMLEDIEDDLEIHDIQFTGNHVLANEGQELYVETKITTEEGTTNHWIALTDKHGLMFSDVKPEGVQLDSHGV